MREEAKKPSRQDYKHFSLSLMDVCRLNFAAVTRTDFVSTAGLTNEREKPPPSSPTGRQEEEQERQEQEEEEGK